MKSTITVRGPITVTYLRNGAVRIEAQRRRPRMHIRGDEFLKLINAAAGVGDAIPLTGAEARCGAL